MIKNSEAGNKILDSIISINKTAAALYNMVENRDKDYSLYAQTLLETLETVGGALDRLAQEEPALGAHLICKNAACSLSNLMVYAQNEPEMALEKIKFELLPLIQELYVDLYFWGFVYPDKEKMQHYYQNEMRDLCPLPYIDEAESKGAYPYDISIVVVAYNKLEYTKLCLNHIQKYFPGHISHELILVNNGSSDGTKEYFKSLHPDKQIDILYNTKSFSFVSRAIEGKYILFVSNDVLITPNSVENMLACIESDERIGCVVPVCQNISNLQAIPADYSNIDEMIAFSQKNNISDPYKWEQRVRLCIPIALARSRVWEFHSFFNYLYPFSPERFLSFSDDLMSMMMRRNGYKNILAKDAYVHHFGSVSLDQNKNDTAKATYLKNCLEFQYVFGLNPWGEGSCFDRTLIEALPLKETESVNILGVNCGLGSDPLKIRETIKETQKNLKVKIYSITNNPVYCEDLKGVSDEFKLVDTFTNISDVFPDTVFQYIVFGTGFEKEEPLSAIMRSAFLCLNKGGVLAVKGVDPAFQSRLAGLFERVKPLGTWSLIFTE